MKKVILKVALGTALVAGLFFTADESSDLATDLHPSIFSIEEPVSFY
ncbi:hypothetical protein [Oceanobacillus senegalensis]|nr:hypothetical protein [Oceanobacillus senegalensis]